MAGGRDKTARQMMNEVRLLVVEDLARVMAGLTAVDDETGDERKYAEGVTRARLAGLSPVELAAWAQLVDSAEYARDQREVTS